MYRRWRDHSGYSARLGDLCPPDGRTAMRVLIGYEISGIARRAFAALGHDVWSCDTEPAEDHSNRHIICDIRDDIRQEDLRPADRPARSSADPVALDERTRKVDAIEEIATRSQLGLDSRPADRPALLVWRAGLQGDRLVPARPAPSPRHRQAGRAAAPLGCLAALEPHPPHATRPRSRQTAKPIIPRDDAGRSGTMGRERDAAGGRMTAFTPKDHNCRMEMRL